jgi:hypothetical protein
MVREVSGKHSGTSIGKHGHSSPSRGGFGSPFRPTYGYQIRGTRGFEIVGFAGQPPAELRRARVEPKVFPAPAEGSSFGSLSRSKAPKVSGKAPP